MACAFALQQPRGVQGNATPQLDIYFRRRQVSVAVLGAWGEKGVDNRLLVAGNWKGVPTQGPRQVHNQRIRRVVYLVIRHRVQVGNTINKRFYVVKFPRISLQQLTHFGRIGLVVIEQTGRHQAANQQVGFVFVVHLRDGEQIVLVFYKSRAGKVGVETIVRRPCHHFLHHVVRAEFAGVAEDGRKPAVAADVQ